MTDKFIKARDVKYSSEQIEKEAQQWLDVFAAKMKYIATEIIGEIEASTVPHIESDAWVNYRESLRLELENEYKYSRFKNEWAINFRRAVFGENREELSKLIADDLIKRNKELEDRCQEYDSFRYSPQGDDYKTMKKRLEEKLK